MYKKTDRLEIVQLDNDMRAAEFDDTEGDYARIWQSDGGPLSLTAMKIDQLLARKIAWVLFDFANYGRIEGPDEAEQLNNLRTWLSSSDKAQAMDDGELIDYLRDGDDVRADRHSQEWDAALTELIDRFMSARGILVTPGGEKSRALVEIED